MRWVSDVRVLLSGRKVIGNDVRRGVVCVCGGGKPFIHRKMVTAGYSVEKYKRWESVAIIRLGMHCMSNAQLNQIGITITLE